MSFTTIPQSTLPENRPTRLETHPSGYVQHSSYAHPGYGHSGFPQSSGLTQPPGHSRPRRPSPYPVLPRHLPEHAPSWRPEPRTGRHRRDEQPNQPPALTAEAAYAARLQEIAWDRFLRKTADFAAVHVRQRKPSIAVRLTNAIKHAFATITCRSHTLPTATA